MIPELLAMRDPDERATALQALDTYTLEELAVTTAEIIHNRTASPDEGIDTQDLLDLATLLRNIDDILEQS